MTTRDRRYRHYGAAADRRASVITNVHRKAQDLSIADRLIEPQTVVQFIEFSMTGVLPNGKQTSLELLTQEEVESFSNPAVSSPEASPPFHRILGRIGSMEDFERICLVGKNIQAMKNRIWAGIVPLSEQRWREKGLSDLPNFELACQHLSAVVAAWEYLNQPTVAKHLRDTFNLIWGHWQELEVILNAARSANGTSPVSVTALWTEFMAAHFQVITERSHRWVQVHVTAMRAPLMRNLLNHRPFDVDVMDRIQWKITDQIHILNEIMGVADYGIMIPMHGYRGYTPPAVPPLVAPVLRAADYRTRGDAYAQRLKLVSRLYRAQAYPASRHPGGAEHHVADPQSLHEACLSQVNGQHQVRREIRGDPIDPVPREPWVASALRHMANPKGNNNGRGYGVVVYRLTYGQSATEWAAFMGKLDQHVADWGRGQTGSGALKPHLKLHWVDGKDVGIAENDIDAARTHYMEHYSNLDVRFQLQDHINHRMFLAIDEPSFASYTSESYSAATPLAALSRGNFTGFVLAVDCEYNPHEPDRERYEECPGYHGQMRVLGSLVWGDLYGLMSSQAATVEDLWALALDHPNLVYTGIPVPVEITGWRKQNGLRNLLLRGVVKYALDKLGMPGAVPDAAQTYPAPRPPRPPTTRSSTAPTNPTPGTGVAPPASSSPDPQPSTAPSSTPTTTPPTGTAAARQFFVQPQPPTTASSTTTTNTTTRTVPVVASSLHPQPSTTAGSTATTDTTVAAGAGTVATAASSRPPQAYRPPPGSMQDQMVTAMMRGFRQWLRDNGRDREAIAADEILRAPHGEDMERIVERAIERQRRVDAGEGDPGHADGEEEEDQQGGMPNCPPQ